MKITNLSIFVAFLAILLMADSSVSYGSQSGIKTSIKRYAVVKYKNLDILCEPYLVKKGDFLYKIFKKKGGISQKNFTYFLDIFRSLNTGIRNIDAIRPGQYIIIPLKEIEENDFRQTKAGVVAIPEIEYATMPEAFNVEPFVEKYKVQSGDTVSGLLDKRFMKRNGGITKEGLMAFKLANPKIKNINRIYRGAYINLPNHSITKQSWFRSLFARSEYGGRSIVNRPGAGLQFKRKVTVKKPVMPKIKKQQMLQLNRYASLIGGKLQNQGEYYIPGKDQSTYVLDLESIPVIETRSKEKIIFLPDEDVDEELLQNMRFHWKNLKTIKMSEAVGQARFLADQKIGLPYSSSSAKGFNDNHQIVTQLLSYSSYQYIPKTQISFSINDVKLSVDFGRIVRGPDQRDVLLNFANLYGFGLQQIKKRNFDVILIKPAESVFEITQKIFSHLGFTIWENPSFKTGQGISTLTGLYLSKASEKLFLGFEQLDFGALDYLKNENVVLMDIKL